MPTPRRLPNRHSFGVTMPASTGIALAMERKLTARWCYQCSKPCSDTPKSLHCGKSPSTRTTHMRNIYSGTIDGKVVFLCRQVDDIAVACSDPPVTHSLIDSTGNVVDLKPQGIFSGLNGIDIDQRRECVKVSCQSFFERMLKTDG
jgi:hypothetical protein